MDQKISKIQKKVQLELDESRYEHTQGVMYTAAALAMCYGEDVKKSNDCRSFFTIVLNVYRQKRRYTCAKIII